MNTAMPTKVQVFCTNGIKSVFTALDDELSTKAGASVAATFASTKALVDRIAGGERPDLAILSDEAIEVLIGQGKLAGRRVDIAKASIGVAVRKGAPHPDIGSTEAFIRMLRAAPSISRSRRGISGLHFADVIERLGLTLELAPKIKVYDGHAGQACANGETDVAIQQISELMPIDGLDILGPLPNDLQKTMTVSAAIGADSKARSAAEAVIAYVKSQTHVLRAKGLDPA